MTTNSGVNKLILANKLYIQKGFEVLESFMEVINATYEGQMESINFNETDAAVKVNFCIVLI